MIREKAAWLVMLLSLFWSGAASAELLFPHAGSTSAPSGRGSFRFGAATAATQIEDKNTFTDWYAWTSPPPFGLGRGEFVDSAAMGYSLSLQDVSLIEAMHLDSYRFGVEWARVEPEMGRFDEEALKHYSDLVDQLLASGITPMITLHHFAIPIWVDDPRKPASCPEGPQKDNLCGFANPEGMEKILDEASAYACTLGKRLGDRVDDWITLNEPINFLISHYGGAGASPGRDILRREGYEGLSRVLANLVRLHVAFYNALKACDTVDADGDGMAASVGLTLAVVDYTSSRDHAISHRPDDIAAASRVRHFYHYLFADAVTKGMDATATGGRLGPLRAEWQGKLDWLGVQYYPRLGVSARIEDDLELQSPMAQVPGVKAEVCMGGQRQQACFPPEDPSHWVPAMQYEFYEPGLFEILQQYTRRYPRLPLLITETGIATDVGMRRAQHVVRTLEQTHKAMQAGVDVRGLYHWSLLDNFEWGLGFRPHFGLYSVDRQTFERTPTMGALVLGQIAQRRAVSTLMQLFLGGTGPMAPETGAEN